MKKIILTTICLALMPFFSYAAETSANQNLTPSSLRKIGTLISKKNAGSKVETSVETVNYFIKICGIKEEDIKAISKQQKNEWDRKVASDIVSELGLQNTPTSEISKNWNSSLCKDVRKELEQIMSQQDAQQKIDILSNQNKYCVISESDLDIILKINKSVSEKEREEKLKKYGLINDKGQQTFSSPVEISNNWHSRKCESVRKEISAQRIKLSAAGTIIQTLNSMSNFNKKTTSYPGIEQSPHQTSAGILSATQDQYERLMPDNQANDASEKGSDGSH